MIGHWPLLDPRLASETIIKMSTILKLNRLIPNLNTSSKCFLKVLQCILHWVCMCVGVCDCVCIRVRSEELVCMLKLRASLFRNQVGNSIRHSTWRKCVHEESSSQSISEGQQFVQSESVCYTRVPDTGLIAKLTVGRYLVGMPYKSCA